MEKRGDNFVQTKGRVFKFEPQFHIQKLVEAQWKLVKIWAP